VIGLSGGLDADVVARLTVAAIGPQRVKLFTVRQAGLEEKFVENARRTAAAFGVHLVEIDLAVQALALIATLAAADPAQGFLPAGLLDPARAKSALRTALHTVYVERGYTVVGTSNRTEWAIGLFSVSRGRGLAPGTHRPSLQRPGLRSGRLFGLCRTGDRPSPVGRFLARGNRS